MTLRPLRPEDEPHVRGWLEGYLQDHLNWWRDAYGQAARTPLQHLIEREWLELQEAARSERHLLVVLDDAPPGTGESRPGKSWPHSAPLGIVQAGVRADRYMGLQIGVLQWIYVAPARRGRGSADLLMRAALAWMDTQGVAGREVFVTARNPAAVRLYERHGFQVADFRMLAQTGQQDASTETSSPEA